MSGLRCLHPQDVDTAPAAEGILPKHLRPSNLSTGRGVWAFWPVLGYGCAVVIIAMRAASIFDSVGSYRHGEVTTGTAGGEGSSSSVIVLSVWMLVLSLGALWGVGYLVLNQLQDKYRQDVVPRPIRAGWSWQTVAAVGGFTAAGWVSVQIANALERQGAEGLFETPKNPSLAETLGPLIRGPAEEPIFVGLPVLAAFALAASRPSLLRPSLVAAVVLSGLARAGMHLYQGSAWAMSAFVWGSAAVLSYLWLRSMTGLMLAHLLYNAGVVAGMNGWGQIATGVDVFKIVSVVGLAGVLTVVVYRRNCKNPGQQSSTPQPGQSDVMGSASPDPAAASKAR